jgi:hypothetical protein
MTIERELVRTYTAHGEPGFLGAGHTALPILAGGYSNAT